MIVDEVSDLYSEAERIKLTNRQRPYDFAPSWMRIDEYIRLSRLGELEELLQQHEANARYGERLRKD